MVCVELTLTVFFEGTFWIGLLERRQGGMYEVCRIIFGAEPKDGEVLEYILLRCYKLKFSPPLPIEHRVERRVNPKRVQREIRKQFQGAGIGTKAQQALSMQREEGRTARKIRAKAERELERERQFSLRQEKRKEKHRGH